MLKFKTGIVLEGAFTDRDIWKPMLDQAFEKSEFATLIVQVSIGDFDNICMQLVADLADEGLIYGENYVIARKRLRCKHES